MIKARLVTALFVLALPSTSALAQTGEEVLMRCLPAVKELEGARIPENQVEGARWCVGYLAGMIDGITLMTSHLATAKICFPKEGLSPYQSAKVVTDWLKANPRTLHDSGRVSVVVALGTAFPCASR